MRPHPLVLAVFACVCARCASAQTIVPVDVAFNGGAPDGPSLPGGLSADGRFAVFASDAGNLVPGDTVLPDVFVRDLELGTTTRITANNASVSNSPPAISADGNVVGWTAGLSPQRTAFAFDRTTATTFPLATSLFDVVLWGLDADGSSAVVTARVTGDDFTPMEVYRVDVASGALVLCSRFPNGNPLGDMNGHLLAPRIDGSGDRVVFATARQGLVPGDADLTPDVYVFDIGTSTMTRASVRSDGTGGGGAGVPAISVDGRIVGFNAVGAYEPSDTNGVVDTYVRDLENLTTTRAALTSVQTEYTTDNRDAAVSPEGTHVAFTLQVPTGGFPSVRFETRVRTLETGITRAVDFGGAAPPETLKPVSMSSSGSRVLALQRAVPGGQTRAVVIEFGPPCSISNYCTSLPNSTGEPAFISAQGEASLEANSLVIAALGMPRSAMTVLLMADAPIDPGTPFGHGLQCVGRFIKRMGSQPATDGVIIDAQDVHGPRYAGIEPGDVRYFQVWYRDAAAPGGGFNTTDAIAVSFCW